MQYLPQLMLNQLGTRKRVDIHAVGSLQWKFLSAERISGTDTFKAPGRHLLFEAQQFEPDFILKAEGLNEKISEELSAFILASLDKDIPCVLPGVGTFSKLGNDIHFEADPNSPLLMHARHLGQLTFTPIKRMEGSGKPLEKVATKNSKPNWKRIAVTAVWVLIFMNVAFLTVSWLSNLQRKSYDKIPVNLPEGRVNVKPSDDIPIPQAIPMPKDSLREDAEDWDSEITEEDSIDVPSQFQNGYLDDTVSSAAPELSPTPREETKKSPESNEVKTVTPKIKTDAKADCAIILGAFGNADNVQSYRATLEAQGYQTYTQDTGRLTRVGVKIACSDAEDALQKAKKHFNQDAWLLQIK